MIKLRLKKSSWFVIIIGFILLNCNKSNEIILEGFLGTKLKSKFNLIYTPSNNYYGTFEYTEKNISPIEVSGHMTKNTLILHEFTDTKKNSTGKFEGTFDGTTFSGYWMNPEETQKVPFKYAINKRISETINNGATSNIQYSVFDKSDGLSFYHGLKALKDEQEYIIFDSNDSEMICINLLEVRDFDKNGLKDALIELIDLCGGNGWPHNSLFFVAFNTETQAFYSTEPFGSINKKPIIKEYKDGWSVSFVSYNAYDMYRAEETYILKNGKSISIKYDEIPPIKSVFEITDNIFEGGNYYEKTVYYDLDSDGKKEKIKVSYWSRWELIKWEIEENNKIILPDEYCHRLGVLNSKTNGLFDLVYGLDDIYRWDGKKYVKK